MMHVLLDINVVLDVFLDRKAWLVDSAAVVQANHEGRITAYLSAVALPTIHYVVRRHAGLEQAERVVADCLDSFQTVSVDHTVLKLAQSLPGSDFEDNIQSACVVLAQLTGIVTRDPRGFAASGVNVWSPGELIAKLPPPSQSSAGGDPPNGD